MIIINKAKFIAVSQIIKADYKVFFWLQSKFDFFLLFGLENENPYFLSFIELRRSKYLACTREKTWANDYLLSETHTLS